MTLQELKEVERHLDAAEGIFLESRVYSLEALRIWHSLRDLLVQVTVQRIRLEQPRADDASKGVPDRGTHNGMDQLVSYVTTYQTLAMDCIRERERLLDLRKGTPDGVMMMIDELLETNTRKLACLNRAIEMTTCHIRAEQRSGGV